MWTDLLCNTYYVLICDLNPTKSKIKMTFALQYYTPITVVSQTLRNSTSDDILFYLPAGLPWRHYNPNSINILLTVYKNKMFY